jgi:uroporphyrinogen III methyltransferase/synthase
MQAPLSDRTVLVTRASEQSGEIRRLLEEAGATVLFLPLIRIMPPESWGEVDDALSRIASYDLIAFASVNGASSFLDRSAEVGVAIPGCRIAAVGTKTAEELERRGLKADVVPHEQTASGLVAALAQGELRGKRVLLPQGNLGRRELADGLRAAGALVESVVVYRNLPDDSPEAGDIIARILGGGIDVVTFASPSAAANLASMFPDGTLSTVSRNSTIAVIGPTTAAAVRGLSGVPAIAAEHSSVAGLVSAIITHFSRVS